MLPYQLTKVCGPHRELTVNNASAPYVTKTEFHDAWGPYLRRFNIAWRRLHDYAVTYDGVLNNAQASWTSAHKKHHYCSANASPLEREGDRLRDIADGTGILPLFAMYSGMLPDAGRTDLELMQTRIGAYHNCLSPNLKAHASICGKLHDNTICTPTVWRTCRFLLEELLDLVPQYSPTTNRATVPTSAPTLDVTAAAVVADRARRSCLLNPPSCAQTVHATPGCVALPSSVALLSLYGYKETMLDKLSLVFPNIQFVIIDDWRET